MSNSLPLRVMQLTPPGRGAIAVLRVEGGTAVEVVDACFLARSGRLLSAYPENRLVVGWFGDRPGMVEGRASSAETCDEARRGVVGLAHPTSAHPTFGEEVVVRRCLGGAVEVCCHGGQAALARIGSLLEKAGCQIVPWQSEAADAQDDSTAIAILEGLTQARTERTAAILLDQYHGALDHAVAAIRQAMHCGDADSAKRQLDDLLGRVSLGRRLVRPWRVVLGGPVNVGKSSLVNALVGFGRSIVHDAPGTTRDAVTATTAIDGWPVELCDTAGLHASDDAVEIIGIQLARQRMAEADLAILVFDRSMPWTEGDQNLLDRWPHALVVFNKCDLQPEMSVRPSGCVVSASEGHGLDNLLAEISRRLVPNPPPPGAAVPFGDRQVESIQRLAAALLHRPI